MTGTSQFQQIFGQFLPMLNDFAQKNRMILSHDTFDGANSCVLKWRSNNDLDCFIFLNASYNQDGRFVLTAICRFPTFPLNSFQYEWERLPVSEDDSLASLRQHLKEARMWAESQAIVYDSDGKLSMEPIVLALQSENQNKRYMAASALRLLGNAQVVIPLIEALSDIHVSIRIAAIQALGEIADSRAVEPLLLVLSRGEEGERKSAVKALGNIGNTRAVEPLLQNLGEWDYEMRLACAEALGNIGDTRAVEPLIEVLSDQNDEVRVAAAEALGKIGDACAVDVLVRLLDDESEVTQIAAAHALGRIRDARAIKPLEKKCIYSYKAVRQAMQDAVISIKSNQVLPHL